MPTTQTENTFYTSLLTKNKRKMKKTIRPLLFILVLLLGVNKTNAQSMTGHFDITVNVRPDTNMIRVNYSLALSSASDTLNVSLITSDAVPFIVNLVDASSTVLSSWTPSSVSSSYNHDFIVSALSSGTYYVKVYDNSSTLYYTVPFTK